jgi:hypothetical protein
MRPNEEPQGWKIPDDWFRGSWLLRQLEDAGFGHRVEVRSVPTHVDAADLDELVENFLFLKEMYFKGYSEVEIAKVKGLLKEEVRKLKAFEELEGGGVKVGMVAWVGFAWKE